MKKSKAIKLLTSYHDPRQPGSLGGVTRFSQTLKLPPQKVREVLEKDLGYTLHKPRRRRFSTLPVLVLNVDQQWVVDLVEVQNISKYNKGMRYLLMVIDAFSKYAWVEPIKTETGKAVTEAFEKILKRAKSRKPVNLQTDDGKEFYNSTFAALMKQKDIHHFSTNGDTKASIVERFNRTFKERLYRYFTVKNTLGYLPVLPDLVKGYNASYHRTIGEEVWDRMYGKRLPKKTQKGALKVTDSVRLNKKFRQFKKGYLPGWTEEVFVVQRVIPGVVPTYKFEELDGTLLKGTFYEQDLQKVNLSKDDLFRVDKVVKRKENKVFLVNKD